MNREKVRVYLKQFSRRNFLAIIFNFAWVAPLSIFLNGLSQFLRYEPPTTGSTQFSLGTAELLPKLPAYFAYGQVWLHQDNKGYTAMDAICTHLGCTVRLQPSGNEYRCPCHGSRFDLTGKVLQGPAARTLPFLRLYWGTTGQLVVDRTQQVDSSFRLPPA